MSGNYRCTTWLPPDPDHPDGRECGERFEDLKGLNTHASSHVKRPCRWCGQWFSNNGHTQHQSKCTVKPEPMPWHVWEDLLTDLLAHANEIPTDAWCVVSTTGGAVFMTPDAARRAVLLSDEASLCIPAALLTLPDQAARWRRRDPFDSTANQETTPSDHPTNRTGPRPPNRALPGVDWDAYP